MCLCPDSPDDSGRAIDIDAVEVGLAPAPDGTCGVYHSVAVGDELFERGAVGEVSLNKGYAGGGKLCGCRWIPDQCPNAVTPIQQGLAQGGTDKPGSAGNGDEAAFDDQAEATLRRTSSAAASSISTSLLLMKSSRALARDNLPDEVRGSE